MNSSSISATSTHIMVAIYVCNAFINLLGMALSVGLILITVNNRRLHSTCFLLIGFCAFCTFLLLSQHFIPLLVLLIPSSSSIAFLPCFLLHILPVFGIFSAISLMGVIGLDRLFSVFFPFWYAHRNEELGLAALIALSSIFPVGILLLMFQTALKQPEEQMLCTLNELLGENTSLMAALCVLCNFLSILCYLIVWAKLKWDLQKNGTNAAESISSRQPIFKSLAIIVAIQVGGWCISESAFAFIFFQLEKHSAQQRYLAAITNCFVCVAASTDPIVLFLTSVEYRKAFCEQFPILAKIWQKVKHPPHITASVAMANQQNGVRRQAWNTIGSQSVSRMSSPPRNVQ